MSMARGADRAALTARAALASVAVALLLLGLKAWAALETGSVAMLASLADTGLDLVASLVTLFGVRVAGRPADADHRFGHGKAEALAALFQVAVISVSAVGIGWQAMQRLLSGATSANAEYGIAVSVIAIAATLGLTAYQRAVIRRTGSVAILTDRLHYQSDLLLNLSVIAALALDQYFGLTGADPLFGLAIALWLLFGALRASTRAIDQLMDKEWPDDRRRRVVEIAARHPEVRGVHDLRTRSSGVTDHIQFHIWIDPGMTVAQAHRVVEAIETELAREFAGADVLIHLDPEGQVDQPDNPLAETDETEGLRP
ncbi:cation diffusion facilitator family transporter [Sphingosinicella sp. LHD-64]|uniref:cation diffusion facilitator family transporter n=1 Tax=Sphingosinicella sp. LHD-64 TaxID=3072139 RepID=UPI00280D2C47|nr:cation diffusion facilitator family transporter [Sphingosinicella sp. LHD-64]MDQ8758038.1 cation diffusion facilitator family transporter [Sphingosinicella sp. LHD-64]